MGLGLGGIGSIIGGPLSSIIDVAMPFIENDWNKRAAQRSMDFTKDMSNTSWQRGVEDMKKAGINPMLSFMQGGASTPSGTALSAPPFRGDIGHSARDMMRVQQELKAGAQSISESESREALNVASTREKKFDGDISEALSFSARQILDQFRSMKLPSFKNFNPQLKKVPKVFERFRSGAERFMGSDKLQLRRKGEGD